MFCLIAGHFELFATCMEYGKIYNFVGVIQITVLYSPKIINGEFDCKRLSENIFSYIFNVHLDILSDLKFFQTFEQGSSELLKWISCYGNNL